MKIGIVTLGCDKNTVDAEYIAGWFDGHDVEAVRGELDDDTLDAAVLLTCGFIDSARQESVDTLDTWAESKADRPPHFTLAVAGCLSQSSADEIRAQFPEVDLIAGVGEFDNIAQALHATTLARMNAAPGADGADAERSEPVVVVPETPDMTLDAARPRRRLDNSATTYLKIADGCDYACAFCSIPSMKGKYHSVALDILIDEARALVTGGAREIILVAQDIAAYGSDLDDDANLPDLLRRLCAIDGDFWLRLMYFYPGGFSDELIDVMASEPKICPYLDIPLQHLDRKITTAMRRPYSDVVVMDWVDRLRAAIPDVALRSTFIVGFPGEEKKQFMTLLNGLRKLRFDHVGFFPFSREDGTPAATMKRQVGHSTAQGRHERLARRQAQIAEEVAARFIGQTLDVMVDGRFPDTDLYIGHSRYQAPEVDGIVRFASRDELEPGGIVSIRIDAVDGYDLIGSLEPTN